MSKRVLVGMSGGVDSSAAALVLLRAGYEVSGVTMLLHGNPRQEDSGCGSFREAEDAASVCRCLGIPHQVKDFSPVFAQKVQENFVSEYLSGRTPVSGATGI